MSENTDKYRTAVAGFTAVVEAVPADKWSNPSPCQDWNAKQVLGHVIGGTRTITAVETGQGAPREGDPAELAGDDPIGNYQAARDHALGLLTDENLAKVVPGPMGEMPLDQVVGMFLANDVLVHTWDLARAAGIDVTLDPALVEACLAQLTPIDAMIRMPGVFGPKVEPPAGADTTIKLMCFTGRTV
jgi:uncharacterized protein (TIGR03086 family)